MILDCGLPDLDSRTVLDHLRALPVPHRPARIIATSGSLEDRLPDPLVDAFLPKPMTPTTLREALALPPVSDAAAGSSLKVFDPETVRSLQSLRGGRAFVNRVMDEFLSDISDAQGRFAAALGAGAYDELRRIAHRLRGAAASVGANQIEERCRAIEQDARAEELAFLGAHVACFAEEAEAVQLAMSDFYQ